MIEDNTYVERTVLARRRTALAFVVAGALTWRILIDAVHDEYAVVFGLALGVIGTALFAFPVLGRRGYGLVLTMYAVTALVFATVG